MEQQRQPSRYSLRSLYRKGLYLEGLTFSQKLIYMGFIIVMIGACDLSTKFWAEQTLVREIQTAAGVSPKADLLPHEKLTYYGEDSTPYAINERVVIPHFWSFYYLRNYNVGFSMLSSFETRFSPQVWKWIVVGLQLSVVSLLFVYFLFTKMSGGLAFMLVIAGGLSNVIDRSFRGYVVDFIKWYWEGSPWSIFNPWPLFNLADVGISLGVCLLVWILVTQ